jgi:hypothetical protein
MNLQPTAIAIILDFLTIPPFRPPFHHSAIPPFRHSITIPPFRHSITSAIPPFHDHSAILPFRHSSEIYFA